MRARWRLAGAGVVVAGALAIAALAGQTQPSCHARGPLPDPICTPGATLPGVTAAQICRPGYAADARSVPTAVKARVYASYGIAGHQPGAYEVDHLVSLELGGSNDVANLWPEAASPRPGYHEKDQIENALHARVCGGAIPLVQAQHDIATDWTAVRAEIATRGELR